MMICFLVTGCLQRQFCRLESFFECLPLVHYGGRMRWALTGHGIGIYEASYGVVHIPIGPPLRQLLPRSSNLVVLKCTQHRPM